MAREHARVKLSIWEDDEFRALDSDPQHLYFVLMTSLKLDYCGVTDWRPGRIAKLVRDWTPQRVEQAAQVLAEQLYIAVDVESEEVLIRSFIRNDELLDSPNMAVAMRKAHAGVASSPLRAIVVHELNRLRKDKPDLKGWPKVSDLLDRPSLNPSEYPSFRASDNPSLNPSETPSVNLSASPTPNPSGNPSVGPSPTTAPTPATAPPQKTSSSSGGARKRRAALPSDWKPSTDDISWQRGQRIPDHLARRELDKFHDHWRSTGEPKADWSATWRNWLRRAIEREPNSRAAAAANGRPPGWEFQ